MNVRMAQTFQLLYSLTSKGQTQTWQIFVDGKTFYTKEGIKDGTISVSKPTICEGKNEGKANETTGEQQALKEAASKHKKKLDEGYCENEADIGIAKFFEPMLAHKWPDYKDETKYPVFSQPKLDGMRCIVNKAGMWSRKGKPVVSAPHIRKLLQPLFDANPDLVFDGELYNHDLKHNFNKLISLAKKTKPTAEDLVASEKGLEYWVYDYINPVGNGAFNHRFADGLAAVKSLRLKCGKIRWVYTNLVQNEAKLDELFEKYIDHGFEGQMIRTDTDYENKRTKALLKRKDFIDEEYELTDLEEGDGNRVGLATTAYFKMKDGKTFKAGVIGGNAYTADLLKNKKKVIGKMATVCYFNLTPDGVPRFGKMKIIRDYE